METKSNKTLATSCLLLALAVIIGAFGAHGLKDLIAENFIRTYMTANTYHYYHSIALALIALLEMNRPHWKTFWSKFFFGIGLTLFSLSGYIYALTSIKFFALIMPIGGLSFVAGWITLAILSMKEKN